MTPDEIKKLGQTSTARPDALAAAAQRQGERRRAREELNTGTPMERLRKAAIFPRRLP